LKIWEVKNLLLGSFRISIDFWAIAIVNSNDFCFDEEKVNEPSEIDNDTQILGQLNEKA
jgi:hypothetical protein